MIFLMKAIVIFLFNLKIRNHTNTMKYFIVKSQFIQILYVIIKENTFYEKKILIIKFNF